MNIKINGEAKTVQHELTLHQLLLQLNLDLSRPGIAVALNREVIPKKRWHDTNLQPGCEVEVIHAVQGG